MLFTDSIQFAEAIAYAESKQLLPTTLSHKQLMGIGRELKRRSAFSARVTDGGFLQLFNDLVGDIAGGPDDEDFADRATGKKPLLMSVPESKARLKEYLEEVGYQPEPGEEGTLKDLSSHARRRLIVETNVLDTLGFGRFAAGQNEATLQQYPAQELRRSRFSKAPRIWKERWAAALENAGTEGATDADSGRLVALKNHPIWQELGDGAGGYQDTLGNPWPPFAFNSGVSVFDIDRKTAISLGICSKSTVVKPQPVPRLNETAEASVANWDEQLKKLAARGGFKITDNGKVLSIANGSPHAAMRSRLVNLLEAIQS